MNKHKHYIAVIGGSAGSIEQIVDFIKTIRPTGHISYIIETHSAHSLKELLLPYSPLEIVEVDHPLLIKPDTIYIPSNTQGLLFSNYLLRPASLYLRSAPSFDRLFLSLAFEFQEKTIAILLSSSNKDGVKGLCAVTHQGGISIVADPKTSSFSEGIQEAIKRGCVDFILPPSQIFETIQKQLHSSLDDESIDAIVALLEESYPTIKHFKRSIIKRYIFQRMFALDLESKEYYDLLASDKDEKEKIIHRLFNHTTAFFRDKECFEALKKIFSTSPDKKLRIWNIGCSTGEESYSLAILCEEAGIEYQIFASDIDPEVVETARKGRYPKHTASDIENYREYFDEDGKCIEAKRFLKRKITFFQHDIFDPVAIYNIDIVVCRNLLLYLTPQAQSQLYKKLAQIVTEGGYLFVGKSEALPTPFEPVDKSCSLYTLAIKPSIQSEEEREFQILNEELETMNEELRLANEELQKAYAHNKELLQKERQLKKELEKKLYQITLLKEELQKQKEFLENILDFSELLIFIFQKRDLIYVNQKVLSFFDLPTLEELKERFPDFCSMIDPTPPKEDFVHPQNCFEEIAKKRKLLFKKDKKHFFYTNYNSFEEYEILICTEITDVLLKKFQLVKEIQKSKTLTSDLVHQLSHFHSLTLEDIVARHIRTTALERFDDLYYLVDELIQACGTLPHRYKDRFLSIKSDLLHLFDGLDLCFEEHKGNVALKQLTFLCEPLEKYFKKSCPLVVETSNFYDSEGAIVYLILLLLHLHYLLDTEEQIHIFKKEDKLLIQSKVLCSYISNSREEEDLKQKLASLIRYIVQYTYQGTIDKEKITIGTK